VTSRRELIEMLADRCDPESFDAAAARLADEGADGDLVAALRVASAALRATRDERARRERALVALFETAGDLSALRDTDQVLTAIVGRARDLVASDAAYITLFDETAGDTYMRVTTGIEGNEFKRLRLPIGAGLGGLVAASLTPQSTSSYLADAQFDHQHGIDRAVELEHLVAIAGVPILLGRRAIGVLFAANREARTWLEEDVTLLQSLADHAAIALENARLFEESAAAVRELTAANETIRGQHDAVRRAADLHEALSNVVLEGGGVSDVAAAAGTSLGGFLIVTNQFGQLLATGGEPSDADDRSIAATSALPADGPFATLLADGFHDALGAGRTVAIGRQATVGRWVVAVRVGDDVAGFVVLSRRGGLAEADRRSFERVAQATALLLLNERSVAEAEQRLRGAVLDELLSADESRAGDVIRRSAASGFKVDDDVIAVSATVEAADLAVAASVANRIAATSGGLAGVRDGTVVVLLPGRDPDAAAATVHRALGAHATGAVTVGADGPASGVAGIAHAHREADRCRHVLLSLARTGEWATPATAGAFALLLGAAGEERLSAFVDRRIGTVEQYDAARGTDLIHTLEVFLDQRGNLAHSADALIIHVNTLRQRLERLDQLLGASWREPDDSLQLQLAFRIRRLLGR